MGRSWCSRSRLPRLYMGFERQNRVPDARPRPCARGGLLLRLTIVLRGAVGRIRLGATAAPGLYLLPSLLAAYRKAHPTFDLQLEIAAPHTIADRVARNALDMAILAGPLPAGELRARRLVDDQLVIVARPDSPRARVRSVKPRQLESEAWVLREEGSHTRRQLTTWWHRHRLAPTWSSTFMHPDGVKRGDRGLGYRNGVEAHRRGRCAAPAFGDCRDEGRASIAPHRGRRPAAEASGRRMPRNAARS